MRGTAADARPLRVRGRGLRLLVVAALVLAACAPEGGGPEDRVATSSPSPEDPVEPAPTTPGNDAHDDEADAEPDAPAGPRVDNLLEGIAEPARVRYEVDAPGRIEAAVIAYDTERFAFEAGDRLVLGELGRGLTACGALGDAECVRLDDDALAEVGDAVVPAGLSPILATVRSAIDPETAAAGAAEGRTRIAERHARCATLEPDTVEGLEAAQARVCIDRTSGAILRWEVEQPGIGTTTLEATRVGVPRPGDFNPPSEPIDPLESPDLDDPNVDGSG